MVLDKSALAIHLPTLAAVIGLLNTNPTIFEREDELNFTIGVLQGYLNTFVTILFMTEASSAKGMWSIYSVNFNLVSFFSWFGL